MQQGDLTNSFYQFHQSNTFHNPNPNPNPIDPYAAPWPAASASAPPVSTSDYPNYAPVYPPYPQNSDHLLNSIPTAPAPAPVAPPVYPPNPNSQVPAHSHYPYDQNQPSYYPYDQSHPVLNQNSNPAPSYPLPPVGSYEDSVKYDRWGGYSEESSGGYAEHSMYNSQGYSDDGVYKYDGGKAEPYGARGTAGSSWSSSQVMFDDYGRPISHSNGNGNGIDHGRPKAPKVVKAIPKADTEEDVKGGLQKFRVKLLSEGFGQSDMDVLCQIGLDGIRMLDPATNRTLRIYPLETVTRCEVLDSYILAFWAKMPVDIEPKRIRLKSSSYTTNTMLDIVTAASVQLKEIGEGKDPNPSKAFEQNAERKKAFADWMNLMKPPNEEKEHWVPDEAVNNCTSCSTNFNAFVRKHHCRNCGEIFCDKCTQGRTPLTMEEQAPAVRVCDRCMAEVTQRLANAKEATSRSGALLSHEDLAKKLKEEMNRNMKTSAGPKSEGSQMGMREVACPTCTVHLQVQAPTSGSETIECSVCQHPFLISAD